MSRHLSIRPFVALLFATVAAPLASPALRAQSAGVTRLPDSVVARIDRAFTTSGGPDAPGCAVGAARRGETVLTRAYGLANLEYGVPNTPETIFESGSVAKQFTAAAVMLLASEGRLSLDDDVRTLLPEVPDFGKGRTIRIRNLLTHTSGLRDQWGLLQLKGSPPGTQVHSLPMILDLVSRQTSLNFDPGAEYLYSNTGYALAAIIVQRASGMPLARFSAERFFTPLGMTHTAWRDDYTRIVKGRATAYDRDAGVFHTDMPFTNVYGNGGLLTTVGDLLKWNAFLDAPAAAQGGPALVRAMETPMTLTSGRRITYALGLTIRTDDGVREVSHGGSTAGYRTWLARYPGEGVSIAVLCNDGTANPTTLGTVVAAALVSRPARAAIAAAADSGAAMGAAELARYTGLFRASRTQGVLRIGARDGRLITEAPAGFRLTAAGADRFRIAGQGELAYRFADGRVREVLLLGADGDTMRYEPVAAPATTGASTLQAYAGSYWSEELETRVTVAASDSGLVVRRRPAEETQLRPVFADGFSGPDLGTVVFSRDGQGAVVGFGIWAGRVRGVQFVREPGSRPGSGR